jgi:hypothetical protein
VVVTWWLVVVGGGWWLFSGGFMMVLAGVCGVEVVKAIIIEAFDFELRIACIMCKHVNNIRLFRFL